MVVDGHSKVELLFDFFDLTVKEISELVLEPNEHHNDAEEAGPSCSPNPADVAFATLK